MSDLILDNAEKIIAAFGGIRPMAKKLGVAVTTVQGWKERGTIPLARLEDIKEAAKKEGIDLTAAATADLPDDTGEAPAVSSATKDSATPSARASVPPSGAGPSAPRESAPDSTPAGGKAEAPKAAAASAEKVRPVPDAGVAAAESADEGTIIEEEIVEYEDRGWRVRAGLFGIGFGIAAVIGFVAAWQLGAFDQTASLSATDRAAWEARFKAESDARGRVQTQLTALERQLAETGKALATANAALAALRKGGQDPAKQIDGLRAQVAELTKRIDALPKTAGDTGAIARLADRVVAIEKQLAALSAGGGQAAESLSKENARLKESLAAAEKRLTALESRVGQLIPGGGYGALVIAIGQLRDTALAGRPFKAELDRVRVLAKDYPEVIKLTASLAPVAAEGVASRAALAEGFSRAGTAMLRVQAQEGDGAWDKAWGRIKSMVTIRRTGRDVTGTSPAALVTRAENALADGRLAEALKLVGQLPANSRVAGKAWIDAAETRLKVESALDVLQTAVLKMVTGDTGAKQ